MVDALVAAIVENWTTAVPRRIRRHNKFNVIPAKAGTQVTSRRRCGSGSNRTDPA
jgi:hypothetical protein